MTPLVFLDTETTSLQPWRQPWEIAMIRRDDTGQRELSFFVSPIDLKMADPASLKFSRFYERHPEFDGPKARYIRDEEDIEENLNETLRTDRFSAARLIHRWTRGAHIIGAVPNFDTDMLHGVLLDEKLTPAWHYHLIDVETLAVGYLEGIQEGGSWAPPWESDDLSRCCGVEPPSDEERHTALGDARWAMRLYDKIMGVEQ